MAGMCRLLHQARTRLTQRPGGKQGLKALNMSQREQLTAAAPTANASCEEAVMKGWFSEVSDEMWPGQAMSLKIDEVLFRGKSDFQDVMVFQSAKHGRVLILDGVIQATERDEFSYQEMITNLPLCSLKDPPKKVLVVGGGDGGVLREITRHPTIEHLDIAEIDGMVIEMSKKYFPGMSCGFDDDRVHVHVTDGIKFVGDTEEGTYDAIIVDSSDPVGPAAVLFERAFFEKIHRALKPGGVVCTQGECIWLHAELIKDVLEMCKDIFTGGSVQYGFTTIPTYPSGQIGFVMACKPDENGKTATFVKPERPPPVAPEGTKLKPLRYYNSAVHSAAFVLPEFARAAVEPFVVPGTGFQ